MRSAPAFDRVTFETSGGGDGAPGGEGKGGGIGGVGGGGYFIQGCPHCRTKSGGPGGDGGRGGDGGDGAGGSSVGVWIVDGTATLTDVTFDLGPAGRAPLGSPAPAGIQAETYSVQAGVPAP